MGFGDIHGRARVDARNPSAFGVCDFCGEWNQLDELTPQYEWAGPSLINQQQLACRRCISKPQEQFRTIILPPDPLPRQNPRPEYFEIARGILGFTQWIIAPNYEPATVKQTVLDVISYESWVPTPPPGGAVIPILTMFDNPVMAGPLNWTDSLGGRIDRSGEIAQPYVAQPLIPAVPVRVWMLIYNPSLFTMAVSFGTASFADETTFDPNAVPAQPLSIVIGAGGALLWATSQGAAVNTGAMTIIGMDAGQPYYAWESPIAGVPPVVIPNLPREFQPTS